MEDEEQEANTYHRDSRAKSTTRSDAGRSVNDVYLFWICLGYGFVVAVANYF